MGNEKRLSKFRDLPPNNTIRERMKFGFLNSNELAEKVNSFLTPDKQITAEAVRQWVSGYTRPDISILSAIADSLECSIDYLMGRQERPTFEDEFIFVRTGFTPAQIQALRDVWNKHIGTVIMQASI